LRQLGAAASTDLLLYYDERNERQHSAGAR
jgi:hypothetical protein